MSAPTLVPEQFQTDPLTGVEWTEIAGTYGIVSYAIFESNTTWTDWKTWADATGSAD